MRFREYSTSNGTNHSPPTEYVLTSSNNSPGSKNGSPFVWSVSNKSIDRRWGDTENNDVRNPNPTGVCSRIRRQVTQVCSDLFLPVGYPDTVADGYLEYQIYDSIQGLCSYLRGVVSTSAVLMAAGVGDAEATAMSAAVTWAIRDGLGMIGGLLFSYVASPHFDAHVKEFRLLADVLNDIGLTLDMALPLLMSYEFPLIGSPYLVLTSISTLCKVACGISAGATKGNITDHFSISGNRADVNAKESTQETLVSLIGMVLGVWLTKFLHAASTCETRDDNPNDERVCKHTDSGRLMKVELITWTIFLVLTIIHVWANYVGVQRLRLRTLNRERAREALCPLIKECGRWVLNSANKTDMKEVAEACLDKLPSPNYVSESLWKSITGMFFEGHLRLGIRIKDLVRLSSSKSFEWSQQQWDFLRDEFCKEKYMILVGAMQSVSVMIHLGASDRDELKSFLHAHLLAWCLEQDESSQSTAALHKQQLVTRTHQIVNVLCCDEIHTSKTSNAPLINSFCNKKWDMSRLYLGFSSWRCDWDIGHLHEE